MNTKNSRGLSVDPFLHPEVMFLASDRDIIELNDKIEYQKEKLNYLETIIKSLSTRGFLIKNSIEWKKFTMGN